MQPALIDMPNTIPTFDWNTASIKVQTDKLTFDASYNIKSVQQYPEGIIVADGSNGASSFKTNLSESTSDYWKGAWIKMTTGNAENQVRKISAYNGTTKFVTVSEAFTSTPAGADSFILINQ